MKQKKLAIRDFARVKELALLTGDQQLYINADMAIRRIRKDIEKLDTLFFHKLGA